MVYLESLLLYGLVMFKLFTCLFEAVVKHVCCLHVSLCYCYD